MRQRWSIGRFRGRITLSHVIPTDVVFFAAREKIFPAPFLFTCQLLQSAFAPTTGQWGVAVEEGTIRSNFRQFQRLRRTKIQRLTKEVSSRNAAKRVDQKKYDRFRSDPGDLIGYSPHEQARLEETVDMFSEKIQPTLAHASATAMAKRIGISRWYADRIREGYRPQPRHWQSLARLVGIDL